MPETTPDDEVERNIAPLYTWRSALVTSVDCSTCKLVGLVLSLYMNERGGSAFPSIPRLAGDCSLSNSTVREHLNAHLHVQGWLTLIERGGKAGERRRANAWQATTPPGAGGVPHRETAPTPPGDDPTPPGAGAHLVHELSKEPTQPQSFKCPRAECPERFDSIEERDDHYITCDEDFVSAAEIPT